jgi:uncharacterized protein YjbI with pentapeptide repeats
MASEEQVKKLLSGVAEWNAWRSTEPDARVDLAKAGLQFAKLEAANLEEADLEGADLARADLMHANLKGASLAWADLTEADLAGADLAGADLLGTDLDGVNFMYANLTKTNLSWANITAANLEEADLDGARIERTVLGTLDLCGALGLEGIIHRGPSVIGADTLVRTAASLSKDRSRQGVIEKFLREAGLDERYLEFFRASISTPIEFYSCFISYTHKDKPFAVRLHDHLQASGIRCWLDEKQLLPGDDILDEVDRGIRLWDKVLLCCSRASLDSSWWVDK